MNIIPAIDLLGGNAVRLRKGKREDVTVFSERPWELIAKFAAQGASRIHIVDLDGAFAGARAHQDLIDRMLKESPIPVEVGGGIRNQAALETLFDAGASYAVLGTAAVKDPGFAEQACRQFPGKVIIGVDAIDGNVAVEGWVEKSSVKAEQLAARAAAWGAAAVLYTDIARDGMHAGVNVDATAALAKHLGDKTEVIASGGVTSLDDLRALAAANIPYAIIGRALYDNHFTVADAVAVTQESFKE